MSYFDKFNLKPTNKTVGIPNVKMNAPFCPSIVKGDVGLELELEAVNSFLWDQVSINEGILPDPTTKAYWTAKEDGSLRNGCEYVTSTAATVGHVPTLVEGLYASLDRYKTRLKLSNRCSTHVHLNASTWRINQVVSFVILWSLFEPVLIEWCGPRRKTNHFCLSIEDTTSTIDVVTQFLNTGYWAFTDGDKYSAMNLRRLFDLGTIEIRCGDAYDNPSPVISWITFLNQLRIVAERTINPSTLPALISGETPSGLFNEICEAAGVPVFRDEVFLKNEGNFDMKCYNSFRETVHLAYYPWEEWLPMINKEYVVNPFGDSDKGKYGIRFNNLAAVGIEMNNIRNAIERDQLQRFRNQRNVPQPELQQF